MDIAEIANFCISRSTSPRLIQISLTTVSKIIIQYQASYTALF